VGYASRNQKWGANGSSFRLQQNAEVMQRIEELRTLVTSAFVALAVCEREERLQAIQERFEGLRKARLARAAGDYEAMMRTGFVCRRLKWIGGKNGKQVEEYEIDTALVESMNSVEKRAAIETGQEQENVNFTGQVSSRAVALSKVMTIPELEALEKKIAGGDRSGEGWQGCRGAEMNSHRVGLGCRPNPAARRIAQETGSCRILPQHCSPNPITIVNDETGKLTIPIEFDEAEECYRSNIDPQVWALFKNKAEPAISPVAIDEGSFCGDLDDVPF